MSNLFASDHIMSDDAFIIDKHDDGVGVDTKTVPFEFLK